MFRSIASYFFGQGENNQASASSSRPLTFAERLQALHYPEDKIPNHFLCPVHLVIMEEPVMVNSLQSNTYERSSLEEWIKLGTEVNILDPVALATALTITPKIDIKRTPISTITLNTLRKQEIEEFVSSLERIDCLQKKLRDTVEISIECLQTAAEGTDVSREELMSMLADQQREQKRMTTQLKISLIEALQCFITLTEAVIMKEDTMLEEKTAEIKKINEDKMELLDVLRHDLENTHPELFNLPSRSSQPSFTPFLFSSYSHLRHQRAFGVLGGNYALMSSSTLLLYQSLFLAGAYSQRQPDRVDLSRLSRDEGESASHEDGMRPPVRTVIRDDDPSSQDPDNDTSHSAATEPGSSNTMQRKNLM